MYFVLQCPQCPQCQLHPTSVTLTYLNLAACSLVRDYLHIPNLGDAPLLRSCSLRVPRYTHLFKPKPQLKPQCSCFCKFLLILIHLSAHTYTHAQSVWNKCLVQRCSCQIIIDVGWQYFNTSPRLVSYIARKRSSVTRKKKKIRQC